MRMPCRVNHSWYSDAFVDILIFGLGFSELYHGITKYKHNALHQLKGLDLAFGRATEFNIAMHYHA